jgi:translation initiation factor 2B subunit (eIF-2B alpha/beta/delta family)
MKYFQLKKIYKDIKSVKIQGATNIAKAALRAYSLSPKKSTIKKLESLRPTEPMLKNVLKKLSKGVPQKNILSHFSQAQEKINSYVLKLIKSKDVIYTHCHSTNVVNSLIFAKKKGKNFEVYNTETRPLYQGRKTARKLGKVGIKVTMFVDSALSIALNKEQGTKKVSKVFLGSDAILKNGDVINKIGSGTISEIAKKSNISVYIIADSWKFSKENVELEQRNYDEVWDNKIPKNVKLRNPAFAKIPSKNIKAIVSELGILTPKEFVKQAKKLI